MARIGRSATTDDVAGAKDWLRRSIRPLRGPLRRTLAATTLQTMVVVAQAWLLACVLSAMLFQRASFTSVWPAWLGFLALAPCRWWLGMRARRTAFEAALRVTSTLRRRLLARAAAFGPLALRQAASGDLITRLVDGIDALLPYYARYLPQAGAAVLIPLLLALCVLPTDWVSGLVLVVSAPLIPVFMVLVGGAAARASRARFAQLTRLGARFMDALAGLVTLRQLGAAEHVAAALEREGEDYRRLTLQVLRIAFLSALVLEFFATVSIAVVAVLIGFRLLWHDLSFRQGLFILLLAPEFYLPLRALGSLRHARMDALAAAGSLRAFVQSERIVAQNAGGIPAPVPVGAPRITFERTAFTHADGRAALHDCTFELAPQRVTAVVGTSGAGKSTLIDLLLGFAQPEGGRILVDDVDLRRLEPAAWRARIAWVPQRPHVFAGSVRDNLMLANPDADSGAIAQASAASGLDAVVHNLPQRWDTPLGEHGVGLSGGQLQRLALARAFLRADATVLLLDEPTAHLDVEGAQEIDQTIARLAAGRTVLLVAHRLEATRMAGGVVVLRGGRVVEQGSPADLATRAGTYAALLEAAG